MHTLPDVGREEAGQVVGDMRIDDEKATLGEMNRAASATMRAVVQTGYGPPEQVLELADVEPPTAKGDEVLVRIRATSVNTPDWITVTGIPAVLRLRFGLRGPATPIRGTDVAGVVEAVGPDVTDFAPGDEVFGSAWSNTLATKGTFAELTVAPQYRLRRKPASLSFEAAAASPMSGITALMGLRDVGGVSRGHRVLINGASGGVGTYAVQMAKALGAEVTAVCSARNVELVQSLGADHVIDYTADDFTRGERRYDLILDNVLNHPPKAVARVLAADGMLIPNSVGQGGRLFRGLPRIARAMLMALGKTRVGRLDAKVTRENLDALAELFESGAIESVVDRVYPLSEAGAAVAHMLGHHSRGNVVITV